MPRASYPTPWVNPGFGSYRFIEEGKAEIRWRDQHGQHTIHRHYDKKTVEKLLERKRDERDRRDDGLPIQLHWDDALQMYGNHLRSKGDTAGHAAQVIRVLSSLRDSADVEPEQVRKIHVQQWINSEANRLRAPSKGRPDGYRGWKNTCGKYLSEARSFFTWISEGERNPAAGVKWHKKVKYIGRKLSAVEFLAVYAVCEAELRDLLLFLLITGCRIGEAAKMTRADVHDGVWTFKPRKDDIPLQKRLLPLLLEILARQRSDRGGLFWRKWTPPESPVGFEAGASIDANWFGKVMAKRCEKARVPVFRAHSLRRTWATWLAENGEDLRIIQGAMGHTSITTTEIYARPHMMDKVYAAEERLAEQLLKQCESVVQLGYDAWENGLGKMA